MKVGIIYNPNAGDHVFRRKLLDVLSSKLKNDDIFCTSVSYEYLKCIFPNITNIDIGKITNTYLDSINSGCALADMDYIISFGGDGTISDIIAGQRQTGKMVPIFGIGCGTANAGLFIQCNTVEELEMYDFMNIKGKEVIGLDVYEGDKYVGTAFNDVVLSDTIVSTVNHKVCTVNASEFLNGRRVPQFPTAIGTVFTEIKINDATIDTFSNISQIIISPIHNKSMYIARAVTGKLSWLPFYNRDGAMIISSEPVICIATDNSLKPEMGMQILQYLLGEGDCINIRETKGYVIIDGNPRINMKDSELFAKILLNKSAAYKLEVNKYNG